MSPNLLAIAVSVGEALEGLDLRKGRYAGLALGQQELMTRERNGGT